MIRSELKIGSKSISATSVPYMIAEVGSNFDGSLDKALKLIDVAASSGADAVKFQIFRAESLYPLGSEMYELFKSIELPQEWVPILNQHAAERDLHFMASAFDIDSIAVLENINVPAHKVASSEVTNFRLVSALAATGKPLIISTGMCDMVDVEEVINICIGAGNNQVVLMQCGAIYPLPNNLANLRVIKTLGSRFNGPIGFSDHTSGNIPAVAAVGVGARVFEKHFTLDRKSKGPDHFYALEPEELKSYIASIHEAHEALGTSEKQLLQEERMQGRREGLYLTRNLPKGGVITGKDIVARRPAVGMRSRYLSEVIGARVKCDCEEGSPLRWEYLTFGIE